MRATGFMAEVLRRISKQRGPPSGRPWGRQRQRWGPQVEQCRRHVLTSQEGLEQVRFEGTQEWVLSRMRGKEK